MARVSPIPGVNGSKPLSVGELRAMSQSVSPFLARKEYANLIGKTFGGNRDMFNALGYPRSITYQEYWEEYERGGIAERIMEAYPRATWPGEADIVDRPLAGTVDTSETQEVTPFEEAIKSLFHRLGIFETLLRADILAGIGRYSVVVIGAPGPLDSALDSLPNGADDIMYLAPYPEDRATVGDLVEDPSNPRFGLPEFYTIEVTKGLKKSVHWTRTLHIAEGLLDNNLFGKPRLRGCFNYLIDLAKIVGGGSEAAWKRMDPGLHVDIDPDIELDPDEEALLEAEVDDYIHDQRKVLRTRGTKVTPLFANVAAFATNVDSVLQLISATTSIPHRILTGSERGQLASTQDRNNWNDRVRSRRRVFADPILHAFIHLLIRLEAVPAPLNTVQTRWPDAESMDESQKARAISGIAAANQAQFLAERQIIMTANEMRDTFLGFGPLPEPEPLPPGEAEPQLDKRFSSVQQTANDVYNSEPT